MKRINILISMTVFVLGLLILPKLNLVSADWWSRSEDRPTAPTISRDRIPTSAPQPTQVVTQAPQPTSSGGGGTGGSGGGNSDDPCAGGKSYTGSYCGWSPEKDKPSSSTGGETSPRIGGPEVKGLSYTGGKELVPSDIIFLTGVLCLLLYARSKLSLRRIP